MQPTNSLNTKEATLHAVDYWQILKNRYGIILLTFILVVITASVITYVMPKKYEASTMIQINPLGSKNQALGNGGASQMTRQFFGTQFKIIESEENLRRAVERCQLEDNWKVSTEDAIMILQGGLRTRQERGTDMMEISLRLSENRREYVKPVTEAIAVSYGEMRMGQENKRRKDSKFVLENSIQTQNDLVEDYRNRLLNFSQRTGIIYIDRGDRGVGTSQVVGQELLNQTQAYNEAVKERDELKVQVAALVALSDESLISHVAGLQRGESAIVSSLFSQYNDSTRERAGLVAEGLGESHPRIKMFDARIENLRADLARQVVEVRELLKTQLTQQEATVVRLRESVDVATQGSQNTAEQYTIFNTYVREYEDALQLLNTIKSNYKAEDLLDGLSNDPIIVHGRPKEPKDSDYVSPNWMLNMALGTVAGLIFGVGIAFALELMDTSVKSLEDVERYLQVPVLAVIPKDVGVLHKQSGASPDAEAYRILRTNIEFNRTNPDDNAITVVSGGAGEGKSTTLVNLSYICAQGGYSTLMIDADLRRPRLHTFFDINNTVGLTNYLTTDLMLEDVILQTPIENLFFMPSGILPADAAGILNSRRMSELVQEVKSRFDLVLIDSPPILGVSDASVLSSEVDLTMIVVQHRKLPRNMLIRVKQAVENVGGTVLGVVLNNVDVRSDSQYQYYTSYYTYYAPADSQSQSTLPEHKTMKTKEVAQVPSDKSGDLY